MFKRSEDEEEVIRQALFGWEVRLAWPAGSCFWLSHWRVPRWSSQKWSTTASHLRGFKSPGNTERVRIRFLYRIVKIIWQQHLVFENGMTWNWIQPPVTQPFTESSGPSLLRWVWTLVLGWYWTTGIRTSALVTTYGGVTLCITLYVYIYIIIYHGFG